VKRHASLANPWPLMTTKWTSPGHSHSRPCPAPPGSESGQLRAVHLSRHKWPGGLDFGLLRSRTIENTIVLEPCNGSKRLSSRDPFSGHLLSNFVFLLFAISCPIRTSLTSIESGSDSRGFGIWYFSRYLVFGIFRQARIPDSWRGFRIVGFPSGENLCAQFDLI